MTKQRRDSGPAYILLVEDNPGDVRLTKEAFDESEVSVTLHTVTDGSEALDFLLRRGEYADAPAPDLVLLDLNLPRKNGEEVLAVLMDEPALAAIPVIVLTSSEDEDDITTAYDLGATAYLTKPVDPEEFIDSVQSVQTFWIETARLPPV